MNRIKLTNIILVIGLVQIAAYYLIGSLVSPAPNCIAPPQPDTLLYCQSARQIAAGHPFAFTAGNAPSTGCTSHLYPFLLAVPYLLGMSGDYLLLGGFILNAALYMVFLFGWYHIFDVLLTDYPSKLIAVLLTALSGHAAFSAMGQTDTGLMMAISSLIFASWLKNRHILFGVALAISPWCRPEGMMLCLAFAIILGVRFIVERRVSAADLAAVAAGIISSAALFAFNYLLTGHCQFGSVEFKGYFGNWPFFDAVQSFVKDLMAMAQQILLGMPGGNLSRSCLIFPLLGAIAGWTGFILYPWNTRDPSWKLAGWILAASFGFASVASGGWQGTNLDRYLAWLIPTGYIFIAHCMTWLGSRFPSTKAGLLSALMLLGFQCFSAATSACWHASASLQTQMDYEIAKSAAKLIPEEATVGLASYCGIAYTFENPQLRHLSGIYSPVYRGRHPVKNIELLKHEPSTRFDYWFFTDSSTGLFGADVSGIAAEQVFQGLNGFRYFKTNWAELDDAISPDEIVIPEGKRLADRVDVGYVKDEEKSAFAVNYRLTGLSYKVFPSRRHLGGRTILDIGIPVIGWSEMNADLEAGKDLDIIIRTVSKTESFSRGPAYAAEALTLQSPLLLRVFINGRDAGLFSSRLNESESEFTDIRLSIKGEMISGKSKIEIFGDHIAYGYWFYQ